ncbi:Modification methylase HpaII [Escherichia coli]|uniref:DNA cytosine methyltransferase n=1 Tax=Escherichia coli TaxID=562 RepID=UPI001A5BC327|nr:DNA cytosine methyltransferase [Escherichia coli]VVZ29765.1 Modification methylase HpaII [Escherichia coli]VVZ35856.1 Modification methylase HpaII [Escherichia coli]VWN21100.1 Modification methylase HpaII [Escherichia coli]
MKPIRVLSLFNGMSVGYMALKDAGIPVEKYYSSEIDKYAIAESQANFPDITQLGDVTKWREWDIEWDKIDLLIGGSPCQGLSTAGKQLGLQDPRSMLFYTMMDIFNHIKSLNPNLNFLFENVKMKKESLDIFNKEIGVAPVLINSQHYTPHFRQRYYWYSTDKLFIPPALSNAPKLQDIIEDGWYTDRTASYCIDANYFKGGDCNQYFNKSRRQIVFKEPDIDRDFLIEHGKRNVDYRHLTVQECCMLQGIDVNYFKVSSSTQAYKMLGNGWTMPVISHLLRDIFF